MKLLKLIFSCVLIIFFSTFVKAQTIGENLLKSKISNIIFDNLNTDKIRDSSAIYTFCVKIEVKLKNSKQTVNVEINNPVISTFFNGESSLKEINYAPLMKKRKVATFLCPVFILVFASHKNEKSISTLLISDALEYLSVEGMQNYDVWNMITIKYDKNIYY